MERFHYLILLCEFRLCYMGRSDFLGKSNMLETYLRRFLEGFPHKKRFIFNIERCFSLVMEQMCFVVLLIVFLLITSVFIISLPY